MCHLICATMAKGNSRTLEQTQNSFNFFNDKTARRNIRRRSFESIDCTQAVQFQTHKALVDRKSTTDSYQGSTERRGGDGGVSWHREEGRGGTSRREGAAVDLNAGAKEGAWGGARHRRCGPELGS
jgi:hypothetical protein